MAAPMPVGQVAAAPNFPSVGLNIGGMKVATARSPAGIIALVGVVVVLSTGGALAKTFLFGTKGHATAKELGIDPSAADLDKMISATGSLAKKWRSDAVFHSITANGVSADGTVDLSSGTVTIEYFSPSRVGSASAATRKDAVKRFVFNGKDVNYSAQWDAKKPWKGAEATPVPDCSATKVAKKLKSDGFGGEGSQLSIDPRWGNAWHAIWKGENRWFDLGDCSALKLKLGDTSNDDE